MVQKIGPEDLDVVIKFGGGLHTRASEDDIDGREAADGQNFQLDLRNRELRNRAPFDLVGTVPNEAEIRGGGSFRKADGSVSFFIQAGDTVYEWDGISTFTSLTTVSSSARLRGHWRSHYWALDDKLLVTDIGLVETVKEWDGTTFQAVSFLSNPSTSFGSFYARYLSISNERALFSHVRDSGATTPHMLVGSERSDYQTISVSDRPSSSLSEADPFFLLVPDLRPINGHVEAFGTTVLSTQGGQLFNLEGQSAQDFSFGNFYPGSAASGAESLAYIGNDIIYGRQGRVESVRDTDRFGDAEADDLTLQVSNDVEGYTDWTTIYNSRLNRVHLFADGAPECWVFQNSMLGGEISPWMKWTTDHDLSFQPTFVMSMLDPVDGLEYVFMGDASGNLYRLEGSGDNGDGGTAEITTEFLTKLFSAPLDAQAFNVEGYIKYRKQFATDVDLIFEYAGQNVFNESVTISLPDVGGQIYYGGDVYYGGEFYYGSIVGRLTRRKFFVSGQSNEFQVRVRTSGNRNIFINEIGLRFSAASS